MLKLSEYLEACTGYNENPTEENLKKIQNFISALEVKEYLPLKDKELVCGKVLSFLNEQFNAIGLARYLEMHKIIQGLFSYCINMENDIGDVYSATHAIYDVIFIYGLFNAIYERCDKDYDRLTIMIDNALNAANIGKIIETANLFNQDGYDKWEAEMKEIKSTLDKESVKQLIEMASRETDGSSELMGTISNMALEASDKEMTKSKEQFNAIAKDLDGHNK